MSLTSPTSRFVYASAAIAFSMDFLNCAVATSSIVRVILRMLLTDLRRLSNALDFAIDYLSLAATPQACVVIVFSLS
jgi:hypothetical protein